MIARIIKHKSEIVVSINKEGLGPLLALEFLADYRFIKPRIENRIEENEIWFDFNDFGVELAQDFSNYINQNS